MANKNQPNKIEHKLSSKINPATNESRIIIRVTVSRTNRPSFKTDLFVNRNDVEFAPNGRTFLGIVIPRKGPLNAQKVEHLERIANELDVLDGHYKRVVDVLKQSEGEDITSERIASVIKITRSVSASDIDYNFIKTTEGRIEQERIKEELKKAEEKRKKEAKTFFDLFSEFLAGRIESKVISPARARHYNVLLRDLFRFQSFVRATDKRRKSFTLDVDKFNEETIREFRHYLEHEHELAASDPELFARLLNEFPNGAKCRKRGTIEQRGAHTIGAILRMLRAFCKWLHEQGHTTNYVFPKSFIESDVFGTPFYLTIDERNIIASCSLSSPALEQQRDIFVFQCCVGCRVGDLLSLTPDNISDDGVLRYIASKTKNHDARTLEIPLNVVALAIVEKYRDVDLSQYASKRNKSPLLPFITPERYNIAIKEILKQAGINRLVPVINPKTQKSELRPIYEIASSHMARRTFVGNLYTKVSDPNLIGSMSGHCEGSRAFSRYRAIDTDLKRKTVALLD